MSVLRLKILGHICILIINVLGIEPYNIKVRTECYICSHSRARTRENPLIVILRVMIYYIELRIQQRICHAVLLDLLQLTVHTS